MLMNNKEKYLKYAGEFHGEDVEAFLREHGKFPRRCYRCNALKLPCDFQAPTTTGRKHTYPACNECRNGLPPQCMTPRLRFEILRRDNFTCRYCGRSAPSVVLHVDHIFPRSKGGTNDPANLTTACADCNQGKSDLEL